MVEHTHEWKPMTCEEAYPATSGRKCKCGKYQLGWLCDINAPGGEELNKRIVESLSKPVEKS